MKRIFQFFFSFLIFALFIKNSSAQQLAGLEMLLFEEILISSVSRSEEKIKEAPATVIVISQNEIKERGYHSFIDILDDLPGMDIIKPFGDDYFRNYWRGFRNVISASFLIMIDGLEYNMLYVNSAWIMASFPLSNINRVEIVYGPSSAIYGANAFMGIINVITKIGDQNKEASKTDYFDVNATATYGSNERSTIDVNIIAGFENFEINLTLRIEEGDLADDEVNNNYEWTRDAHVNEPLIWGGFATEFTSEIDNLGLDLKLSYQFNENHSTKLILQQYTLNSGYGYQWVFDKSHPKGNWIREEFSYALQHEWAISDTNFSKTTIRFRESNIDRDTWYVENWGAPAATFPGLDFSYWQSVNESWSVYEDLHIEINEDLSLVLGFEWEGKDLQSTYDVNYGPALFPENADPATYPYPSKPGSDHAGPRIKTDDYGIYAQAKYKFNENHIIHFGIRGDTNSEYDSNTTVRAGYVTILDKITTKILFGQAYKEPSARQLYGGLSNFGGSSTDLNPEESQTLELILIYKMTQTNHTFSLYIIENTDTILNTLDGARNIGERNVWGIDYHLQGVFNPSFLHQLKVWAYYSYIDAEGDEIFNTSSNSYDKAEIGDIADNKLFFGATAYFKENFGLNIRGRFIGERETVSTNPVNVIDEYFLIDLNLFYQLNQNWRISLRADNIFDKEYFHPGIRTADAGNTPGFWDDNGLWVGSSGWASSMLPQIGATYWFSINAEW